MKNKREKCKYFTKDKSYRNLICPRVLDPFDNSNEYSKECENCGFNLVPKEELCGK